MLGLSGLAAGGVLACLGDPRNELRRYSHVTFTVAPPGGTRTELTLLRTARVVDVARGSYYAAGVDLLLEGDRIAALPGLPGEPHVAECARVLDLGGRAILPGLINTHCHATMVNPGFPTSGASFARYLVLDNAFRESQLARAFADCIGGGITTIRHARTRMNKPVPGLSRAS